MQEAESLVSDSVPLESTLRPQPRESSSSLAPTSASSSPEVGAVSESGVMPMIRFGRSPRPSNLNKL